jgi:hypothetical protein
LNFLIALLLSHILSLTETLSERISINSDSTKVKYLKQRIWENLKNQRDSVLNSHQYCMLWCPESEFRNVSEWTFYRDLSPEQARERGSYYNTEFRDVYQDSSMKSIDAVCCQIATRESFQVIYDTRRGGGLNDDVTLVTFGTFERMHSILETAKRWKGPIVLVVYVPDYNDPLFATFRKTKELLSSERIYNGLKNFPVVENMLLMTYNASFEADKNALRIGYNAKYFNLRTMLYHDDPKNELYTPLGAKSLGLAMLADFPINSLRNIAQDYADTRYVFSVDIDFLPDEDVYEYFKRNARIFIGDREQAGIVVPHFERNAGCRWTDRTYSYPKNFESLQAQFNSGLIRPFHVSLKTWTQLGYHNWTEEDVAQTNCDLQKAMQPRKVSWMPGIEVTNYPKWFQMSQDSRSPPAFEISTAFGKNESLSYEPYILLDRVMNSTHTLMRYNEIFTNRQKDKSSWIVFLRISGYQFFVGNRHFLIHQDHKPSQWLKVHETENNTNLHWKESRMISACWVYRDNLLRLYPKSTKAQKHQGK